MEEIKLWPPTTYCHFCISKYQWPILGRCYSPYWWLCANILALLWKPESREGTLLFLRVLLQKAISDKLWRLELVVKPNITFSVLDYFPLEILYKFWELQSYRRIFIEIDKYIYIYMYIRIFIKISMYIV